MRSSADLHVPEWERLKHRIQAALDEGPPDYSLENVGDLILNGEWQWWPLGDSAVITQVLDFPLAKVVRVLLGGGKMPEMRELDNRVTAWARSIGAQRVEMATTRPGWPRVLDTGIRPITIYRREFGKD